MAGCVYRILIRRHTLTSAKCLWAGLTRVPNGKLINLPSEFPFSDNENFGEFSLLFFKGWKHVATMLDGVELSLKLVLFLQQHFWSCLRLANSFTTSQNTNLTVECCNKSRWNVACVWRGLEVQCGSFNELNFKYSFKKALWLLYNN